MNKKYSDKPKEQKENTIKQNFTVYVPMKFRYVIQHIFITYKYRLKRGKPILSLSLLSCFYSSQFFFGLITAFESYDDLLVSADLDTLN